MADLSERYPVADWQYEVAQGYTQRGYQEWTEAKREEERVDIENAKRGRVYRVVFGASMPLGAKATIQGAESLPGSPPKPGVAYFRSLEGSCLSVEHVVLVGTLEEILKFISIKFDQQATQFLECLQHNCIDLAAHQAELLASEPSYRPGYPLVTRVPTGQG